MPDKVIEFSKVSFRYSGPPVLEEVDLTIGRGDFVALVGPNGGGKTTLVKLALGLLAPTSGTVRVFGKRPDQVAGRVGYVPQHTTLRSGFPVTVLDTVRMGLKRQRGFHSASSERRTALDALARVSLEHMAEARFGELSGGQQQRALIARALASKAELLILDEPTANIDPQGSFCFFDFLCELGKAESLTILSVSHDLTIAASHVTAMACVNRRLLYNPAPSLTPDMLHMLYGSHQHTCAMDEHIRRLEQFMGDHQHDHDDHGHDHGEARQ